MNELTPIFDSNIYLKELYCFYFIPELNEKGFDLETLHTSTNNEYIPIINFRRLIYMNNVFLYNSIKPNNILNRMTHFIDELTTEYYNIIGANKLQYTDNGILKTCYFGFGYILDESYNFIFLATFRSSILPINRDNLERRPFLDNLNISKKDVKIFISKVLIKDYKKIYNKINKKILEPYIESGCELSIVDSDIIKDSVYGNEFERNSDFKTLEDRLSFIEFLKSNIL